MENSAQFGFENRTCNHPTRRDNEILSYPSLNSKELEMRLISTEMLKVIHGSLKIYGVCHTIPFNRNPTLDEKTQTSDIEKKAVLSQISLTGHYDTESYECCLTSPPPSIRKVWYCRANLLFQCWGATFSTFRMVWAATVIGIWNVPLLDLGFVTYQACGFAMAAFFQFFIYWRHNDFLAFLNLLVMGTGENDVNKTPLAANNDILVPVSRWICRAVYAQSACNTLLFFARRNGVQYLWGLLGPTYQNGVTFMLIGLYEFLIPANSWNSVLYMYLTYATYTHYLGIHLKKWAKYEGFHTPRNQKSCRDSLMSYRKIQIMHNLYYSNYGEYILPAALTCMLLLVSWMTFLTLKLVKNSVDVLSQLSFYIFPLASFALLLISFVVNCEAMYLHKHSQQLFAEWRQSKPMVKSRVLKSLKPIRGDIGSFYYIKSTSPLNFSSNAIGFTINLLLTF